MPNNTEDLLYKNNFQTEFNEENFQKTKISPELIIFLLKQQLI